MMTNKRKALSAAFAILAGIAVATPVAAEPNNQTIEMAAHQSQRTFSIAGKSYTGITTWGDSIAFGAGKAAKRLSLAREDSAIDNRGIVGAGYSTRTKYGSIDHIRSGDLVIVSAGGNDYRTVMQYGAKGLAYYERWLEDKIRRIQAQGGKPVFILTKLESPYPQTHQDFVNGPLRDTQKKVLDRLGVPYIYQGKMQSDGLHPRSYNEIFHWVIEKADDFYGSPSKKTQFNPTNINNNNLIFSIR